MHLTEVICLIKGLIQMLSNGALRYLHWYCFEILVVSSFRTLMSYDSAFLYTLERYAILAVELTSTRTKYLRRSEEDCLLFLLNFQLRKHS